MASHSSTLFSSCFTADILLLVCRSFSKDEYTAAIERQANSWRDLAAETSSRFVAVKSELDKAVKRSQQTSAEVMQLLSSARARAKYFETSAAELESVLTSKEALLKESEQTRELLSSKLVSQVHVFHACLFVLCACCIHYGALHCMAHHASFSAPSTNSADLSCPLSLPRASCHRLCCSVLWDADLMV